MRFKVFQFCVYRAIYFTQTASPVAQKRFFLSKCFLFPFGPARPMMIRGDRSWLFGFSKIVQYGKPIEKILYCFGLQIHYFNFAAYQKGEAFGVNGLRIGYKAVDYASEEGSFPLNN
jgi:hypothetical protein